MRGRFSRAQHRKPPPHKPKMGDKSSQYYLNGNITETTIERWGVTLVWAGSVEWRRGWDSNPRLSFPNTRFPSVLLKPLGHLSVVKAFRSLTNWRRSGKRRIGRAAKRANRKVCLLHFLGYSGVVQLVARQPLELVILVRVQAPEPISITSYGAALSRAIPRTPIRWPRATADSGLGSPAPDHPGESTWQRPPLPARASTRRSDARR